MCQFASGIMNPKTLEVKVYDITSHSATYKHFRLKDLPKPNSWREFHYLPDNTIECRVNELDDLTKEQANSYIKSKWPTFLDFWKEFKGKCIISDALRLNELASAKGFDLSGCNIGGYLCLDGLTSAKGLDLTGCNIGGGLSLNGLTSAKGLDLSGCNIGGDLYLNGLTSAKGLDLSGCNIGWGLCLDGLTAAKDLDLTGCNIGGYLWLDGLTSAKGLDLSGCDIGRSLSLNGKWHNPKEFGANS